MMMRKIKKKDPVLLKEQLGLMGHGKGLKWNIKYDHCEEGWANEYRGLGVNSQEGKCGVKHEGILLDWLSEEWGIERVDSDRTKPIRFDGHLVKRTDKGDLVSCQIYESRVRHKTIEEMESFTTHYRQWMVSKDKVDFLRILASAQTMPLKMIMLLVPQGIAAVFTVSDENGNLMRRYNSEEVLINDIGDDKPYMGWQYYLPWQDAIWYGGGPVKLFEDCRRCNDYRNREIRSRYKELEKSGKYDGKELFGYTEIESPELEYYKGYG
tara:strand:+ start:60 stop:860 length:801 start_codon:yes stop_codon:yes gene_type:complete